MNTRRTNVPKMIFFIPIILVVFAIAIAGDPKQAHAQYDWQFSDGVVSVDVPLTTAWGGQDFAYYMSQYSSAAAFIELAYSWGNNAHSTVLQAERDVAGRLIEFSCDNGLTMTASYTFPPPTCSVTLDKNPIAWGEKTKIHWSSTRAAIFYINSIGYVAGSGSVNVSPLGTTDHSGHVNDAADGSGQAGQCAAKLVVTGGQCPPGQMLRAGICISQCPAGYTYQNGSCVFVECPAGYVKQGNQCVLSIQCTAPPHCEANDLVDSCTGETIRTCDWGCTAGACKVIPAPSATLKATPSLVHSGNITTVSWTSQNTTSCSVHGTNGNSWTGTSSSGKTSSPILGQTIYTLHCNGYQYAYPPFVDMSVTVNLIPTFIEK